jgi:hypothetical protein
MLYYTMHHWRINIYIKENSMITLKQYMEAVDYTITESSTYQWACYGNNAHCFDSAGAYAHSLSVILDKKTQVVFSVQAYDYTADRAYRWMNPEFVDAYKTECIERKVHDVAWDYVEYIDLDNEEDFLEKARAIFTGTEYDARILTTIDLETDTLHKLMLQAHKQDITLNAFIEQILRNVIASGEWLE